MINFEAKVKTSGTVKVRWTLAEDIALLELSARQAPKEMLKTIFSNHVKQADKEGSIGYRLNKLQNGAWDELKRAKVAYAKANDMEVSEVSDDLVAIEFSPERIYNLHKQTFESAEAWDKTYVDFMNARCAELQATVEDDESRQAIADLFAKYTEVAVAA